MEKIKKYQKQDFDKQAISKSRPKLFTTILLVGLLIIGFSANAQNKKVVVIGTQTALQQKVIGNKTMEIKKIDAPKENINANKIKNTKDLYSKEENHLDGVETVYVNGRDFAKEAMHNNKHIKEALERNIPMVFENINQKDSEKMIGFGFSAKAAIIETLSDGRGTRITIIDDEPETKQPDFETSSKTDWLEIDSRVLDTLNMDPKEKMILKKTKLKENAANSVSSNMMSLENTGKARGSNGSDAQDISRLINDALERHQKERQKPNPGKKTGQIMPSSQILYAANNKNNIQYADITARNEMGSISGISVPDYSHAYFEINMSRDYMLFGQHVSVDIIYDINVYAVAKGIEGSGPGKYAVIKSRSVVNPTAYSTSLERNDSKQRACFLSQFRHIISNKGGGDVIEHWPINENKESQVTTGSGYEISGSFTSLSDMGFSYNNSTETSTSISDFEVIDDSHGDIVHIKYSMKKDMRNIGDWDDTPYVHGVPNLAENAFYPEMEVIIKMSKPEDGDKMNSQYGLWFFNEVELKNFYEKSAWNESYEYHSQYFTNWRQADFTIDQSIVHLPNIAMNATATQSSTSYNGVAVRAIDGDNSGNYKRDQSSSHTNSGQWEYLDIELDDFYSNTVIGSIEIWNRTDWYQGDLYPFPLYVFVSDVPFTTDNFNDQKAIAINDQAAMSYYYVGSGGRVNNIPINRTGKYIRIQQVGPARWLSLSEVRVIPKGLF